MTNEELTAKLTEEIEKGKKDLQKIKETIQQFQDHIATLTQRGIAIQGFVDKTSSMLKGELKEDKPNV